MPIFRKLVKDTNTGVVAINAPDKKAADEEFEKFIEGDSLEKYNFLDNMDNHFDREVTDLMSFSSEDLYHKAIENEYADHDIMLTYKEPEPKCVLVFTHADNNAKEFIWDIPLSEVFKRVIKENEKYILVPENADTKEYFPSTVERIISNGLFVYVFKRTKRRED